MTCTPDSALLHAEGLYCVIAGRTLWRDLTLTIGAGERLAVVGPSGSGKTLLLRTLAALVPRVAGDIRFSNKPLDAWWTPAYRAQVIYVPQRLALPEGTVEDVLKAPFKLRVHRDKRYPAGEVRHQLQRLEMGVAFLEQPTGNLSGGETQLVALLRAVLLGPAILLLDEPTASLDAERTGQVEALVTEWLGAGRRAWVWTSHDRTQLERVSDRQITLQ